MEVYKKMSTTKEKMVQCPGCSSQLPESDGLGQKEHMEREHPDIIVERLRKLGMDKEADRFVAEMENKYK